MAVMSLCVTLSGTSLLQRPKESEPIFYHSKSEVGLVAPARKCKISFYGKRLVGVRCQQSEEQQLGESGLVHRRDALLLGANLCVTVVGSGIYGGSSLFHDGEVAYAADITQRFQRGAFLTKVKDKLRDVISANQSLIPALLKLALNDILTYDKLSKTGGPNGSIRLSEELSRPENRGLEAALKLLEDVKKEIDGISKGGPISWADLIQIGAQSAVKRTFINAAIRKCGGKEEKGLQLYAAYGSTGQWGQFDKQLGRAEANDPDPAGRVLNWEQASASDIKARFAQLGVQPRYVTVLSAFLGPDQAAVEDKLITDPEFIPWVQKYKDSKLTVSQTDYEVDLITTFTKLSTLGQTINYEKYSFQAPPVRLKF